jgi:hypothetical protein
LAGIIIHIREAMAIRTAIYNGETPDENSDAYKLYTMLTDMYILPTDIQN